MSLAARLKSRITALAQSARHSSARALSAAAVAVLLNDPLTSGPRTPEHCNAVGAFLRGLSWFRPAAMQQHLLDCCSYGVAEEVAEGATVMQIGAEAVFVMVLKGRAYVMRRADAKLPSRVMFEGDCEHEGYLTEEIRVSHNSPIAIVAAEKGTVVLRMSRAWLAAVDYLEICQTVGIDFRNPVYDKTTFLGRIPEHNLERLLKRSRVRQFSAHHTILDATPPPIPASSGGLSWGHQHHSSSGGGGGGGTSCSGNGSSAAASGGGDGTHHGEVGGGGDGSGGGGGGGVAEVMYIAHGTVQVKWLFREGSSTWYVGYFHSPGVVY